VLSTVVTLSQAFSSNFDRRRSKRVRPGSLTVAMYEHDGTLLDVSETGALIRTNSAQAENDLMAFVLRWKDESILLRGRVVRTVQHRTSTATESGLRRTEHHVGVEFHRLPPHSILQLQRLVHG
jgi:hypothetical protein